MKSFLELVEEQDHTLKPVVMAFGRMNPPTIGHGKVIDKVHELADKHSAPHTVVLSHSQDTKKNPLSPAQKVKHATRAFPNTHFEAASKESPSILHHAKKLYDAGHRHLIIVAGSDRQEHFQKLLHQYNGHPDHYNFKKIEVKSAGPRDPDAEGAEGMSASKMREHAKNNKFHEFKKGLPSHMPEHHAQSLFKDVRKGMGLHEDIGRGLFKAIFVTGGPGSGKDLIIREGVPEARAVELDATQAMNFLKQEAIRERKPLIINTTADNAERISQIKEELEELGYMTMMVYVDTTNEISQQRNKNLKRMIEEQVRLEKWTKSQQSKVYFHDLFEDFNLFKNNDELEVVEEHITDVYEHINEFLDCDIVNEVAKDWLREHGKLDINKEIAALFEEPVKKRKVLKDNNSPVEQMLRKAGKQDDVRDGDVPANSSYTFKTYEEKEEPTLTVNPAPKVPKFRKDKETGKAQRALNDPNKKIPATGLGPEYDTRQQGTAYPGGLGNVTYKEETDKYKGPEEGKIKSFRAFVEAIDSPAESGGDMGVGGVLNGATNSEPIQTPKQVFRTDVTKKKKKGVSNAKS